MTKLNSESLMKVFGGNTTINGPIINALVNVIELIKGAGYSIGSGIRRIVENELCPLD